MMSMQSKGEMAPEPERRGCARYDIRAQAWVEWHTEEGERSACTGEALNVGLGGLFIAGRAFPPVGSQIRFTVRIRLQWDPASHIVLTGHGEVRHTLRDATGRGGFGVCAIYELEFSGETDHPHSGDGGKPPN